MFFAYNLFSQRNLLFRKEILFLGILAIFLAKLIQITNNFVLFFFLVIPIYFSPHLLMTLFFLNRIFGQNSFKFCLPDVRVSFLFPHYGLWICFFIIALAAWFITADAILPGFESDIVLGDKLLFGLGSAFASMVLLLGLIYPFLLGCFLLVHSWMERKSPFRMIEPIIFRYWKPIVFQLGLVVVLRN